MDRSACALKIQDSNQLVATNRTSDNSILHMAGYSEEPPADVSKQQDGRETYEDDFHINLVPGTEIMADDGSHRFIKSERRHNVLIPQPSNDAHDPLVCSHCFPGPNKPSMRSSGNKRRIGVHGGSSRPSRVRPWFLSLRVWAQLHLHPLLRSWWKLFTRTCLVLYISPASQS